jgi:hypothetical protein
MGRCQAVVLLAATLSILTAACGGGAPRPEGGTATPTTALAGPSGSGFAGDLNWQVEIVQRQRVQTGGAAGVVIERAPFTIRVRLNQPLSLKLNAHVLDENFRLLQPGFVFQDDCTVALCTGMDVAEDVFNPDDWLAVDSLSTHYLYYLGPDNHRWNRATVEAGGAVFERDVAFLNDSPVEEFAGSALYLLLYASTGNPDLIEPGELQKVTVIFN